MTSHQPTMEWSGSTPFMRGGYPGKTHTQLVCSCGTWVSQPRRPEIEGSLDDQLAEWRGHCASVLLVC